MSDLISKRELYHKLGEAYNKGFFSWGANEIIKDIIGECNSVEKKVDSISRQAVLITLDNMDKALDEERTVEKYKELLTECIKALTSAENNGDLISRHTAILEYQTVCHGIACKECPFLEQVTDNLTDCKLERFIHNLPSAENKGFDGMTNGEVIQTLFPNMKTENPSFKSLIGTDIDGGYVLFDREWWNAPYKKGDEDKA